MRSHAFMVPGVVVTRLGLLALCLTSLPAVAADRAQVPAPSAAPRWEFTVNVYAWLAGLEGSVRTLPPLPAVDVNIGIGTVLENLDGAVMGTAEARFDRYILFTDLVASKISPGTSFQAAGVPVNASLESGAVIASGLGGYRLFENATISLDVLAGARLFSLNNTLSVAAGPLAQEYGNSQEWVDAIAGMRAIVTLSDRWFMSVIGLGGGGSSNYEWDLFGGLGYRFNDTWSAFAGYRALKVDYRRGDFIYDALQHGPVLGAQIRF